MPEIGATLREARMRARIDVSEIEAQTKIRAKYLRAIENEEFDLLPGPTFVKSFLRTYAQALGLDPKPLLEEYRSSFERPSELELQPLHTGSHRTARAPAPRRTSLRFISSVAALLVVIGVLLAAVMSGGSGGSSPSQTSRGGSPAAATGGGHARRGHAHRAAGDRVAPPTRLVSVQLVATAPVYVCLETAGGAKPLDGVTLSAGQRTATFRSHNFRLTLGNNAVTLLIDGTPRPVAASSTAISYRIDAQGRHPLSATSSALPHCP